MNKKDRQKVLTTIGQDWLEFILDKILRERVLGLVEGILIGWSVVILVLVGVFKGDTIEIPRYAVVISAVILGLMILVQVWNMSRLTNK